MMSTSASGLPKKMDIQFGASRLCSSQVVCSSSSILAARCTAYSMCGCVLAPPIDSSPPGRLSWDGNWRGGEEEKRRRETIKGAGASLSNRRCWNQQIFLCSPPRHAWRLRDEALPAKVQRLHKTHLQTKEARRGRGGGINLLP